jgi:epoxyqueuosine reductase QueG
MNIHELRKCVVDFCRDNIRQRQLPDWWRDPLLATATADRRFDRLPRMAAPNHMLPGDLLASCRTVIVFFIPFSASLSSGNVPGKLPSDGWGMSLSITNDLIQGISEFIRDRLAAGGHASMLTPVTDNFDPESLTARWSHKHLAHLAGLGRFGLNAQLITPAGCAGRLGSMVTEAALGDHPLVEAKELCLYKAGHDCQQCLHTCPVKAVTRDGIDRHRCNQRLELNRQGFAAKPAMRDDIEVCAKCVSGMPCSLQSPIQPCPDARAIDPSAGAS